MDELEAEPGAQPDGEGCQQPGKDHANHEKTVIHAFSSGPAGGGRGRADRDESRSPSLLSVQAVRHRA
jgi:hypothetical protein